MNSLIARRYLPVVLMIISFYMEVVNGSVTLVGRNPALSFEDAEALFGMSLFLYLFQFSLFSSDSGPVEDSSCN